MVYIILLIVGSFLVETSGFSLTCTNNYDKLMSCYIDSHNCTGLTITLNKSEEFQTEKCAFDSCVRGCCCATEMMLDLLIMDEYLANVYKDGQSVLSKTIKVYDTIKPPPPSIYSVSPFHEIYQVKWGTNAKRPIRAELSAILTYQKKGDDNENSNYVKPSTMEDINHSDILGRNLEPSTTYVVSVKTNTSFGVLSESSNVVEFTTASSSNGSLIAMILCLSVGAIAISAVAFASFVNVKGKLWDKAAKDEKPKLLDIKPNEKVILKPESLNVHSLSVEPLIPKDSLTLSEESLSDASGRSGHTSGISMASSSLAYAETQPIDMDACVLAALQDVFPIFTPAKDSFSSEEPVQSSVNLPPFKKTSSPIVFDNQSYISNSPTDDVHMQKTCDSGYHSSDGPTLHDFIIPPHVSANMEMDMSYQPCAQSGEASSPSQNLLSVVYGYQGFEKLVKQSNNMSSTENAEECPSLIPGLTNDKTAEVDPSHCVIIPHVSKEIIVEHGYHCV